MGPGKARDVLVLEGKELIVPEIGPDKVRDHLTFTQSPLVPPEPLKDLLYCAHLQDILQLMAFLLCLSMTFCRPLALAASPGAGSPQLR